jgi:methyl-accepting chemotaxis protein
MKNISISLKLVFSVGALACGYLLFLGLSEWSGSQTRHHMETISGSLFPSALASQESIAAFTKLNQDFKDAVVTQDSELLNAAEQVSKHVVEQLQLIHDRNANNPDVQQRSAALIAQLGPFTAKSKAAYSKMLSSPNEVDDQLMASIKDLTSQSTAMGKGFDELNAMITRQNLQAELAGVSRTANLQRLLFISLFLAAVVFAVFITLLLQRQIAVPLRRAVEVLDTAAAGNLTVSLDVKSQDEVGKMAAALNEMLGKQRGALMQVFETAHHTNSTSQQLNSASGTIASGAQEQAASLEETSASLEQITATIRHTADNARQASQLTAASANSAIEGQDVVAKAIHAMGEIDAASQKISDIISTIDEIAFQTNLLAVNAAVEAARAGEEGRGFAVVASEVRSLAQRSALSAKEIKTLIQDSVRKVAAGSSLVNRSGETLQGIVTSVKRASDIVAEIAAAAAEQSTGIEQVNQAMTQMDRVTQANSSQTEELSATAQALSEQAAHLLDLISRFEVGAETGSGGSDHPAGGEGVSPAKSAKVRSTVPKGKRVYAPTPVLAAAISSPAGSTDALFDEF